MFFISIYKPNAILMKAPAVFLLELENLFLKCKWNNKWWRRTKPHQKNKMGVPRQGGIVVGGARGVIVPHPDTLVLSNFSF